MQQEKSKTFSAILLAGGESRRMEGVNKLTLAIGQQSMLRYLAQTLLATALQELVVVTGYQQQVAERLVAGLDINLAHNPDYRSGQMSSVYAGMAAIQSPCDAIILCPADLALLQQQDIDLIRHAFNQCPTSIMVPAYGGQRGSPMVLDYQHRCDILAADKSAGCRRLLECNPQLITSYAMPNDHVVVDVDTVQAYAEVAARLDEKC